MVVNVDIPRQCLSTRSSSYHVLLKYALNQMEAVSGEITMSRQGIYYIIYYILYITMFH